MSLAKFNRSHKRSKQSISNYINEPEQLRMLILAGTLFGPSEFNIIGRCARIIKLDLSNNRLSRVPEQARLNKLQQLRILFLHQNLIQMPEDMASVLQCQKLQYITLRNNPLELVQLYRKQLIGKLKSLVIYDQLLITSKFRKVFRPTLTVNFPLVEYIEKSIENQKDYLNFLRLQVYQIARNKMKVSSVDVLNVCFKQLLFKRIRVKPKQVKASKELALARKYYKIMRFNFQLRKKMRRLLQRRGQVQLTYNFLQYKNFLRSSAIQIVKNYVQKVRTKIKLKRILHYNFRKHIQCRKAYFGSLAYFQPNDQKPRIYLPRERRQVMDNILNLIKGSFFKRGEYQVCQNFQQIIKVDKSQYSLSRLNQANNRNPILSQFQMLRGAAVFKFIKKNQKFRVRNLLKVKCISRNVYKLTKDQLNKYEACLRKDQVDYNLLICVTFSSFQIFKQFCSLIWIFNSGVQNYILSSKTAYFQTQVQQQIQLQPSVPVFYEEVLKRWAAATTIQKFYKRYKTGKTFIQLLNKTRAARLIQKAFRSRKFLIRAMINKKLPFIKGLLHSRKCYLPIEQYMNLKDNNNSLSYDLANKGLPFVDVYSILHYKTRVNFQGKFIKIQFQSLQVAKRRQQLFVQQTFDAKTKNFNKLLQRGGLPVRADSNRVLNQMKFFVVSKQSLGNLSIRPTLHIVKEVVSMFYYPKGDRPIKVLDEISLICANIYLEEYKQAQKPQAKASLEPLFRTQQINKRSQPPHFCALKDFDRFTATVVCRLKARGADLRIRKLSHLQKSFQAQVPRLSGMSVQVRQKNRTNLSAAK